MTEKIHYAQHLYDRGPKDTGTLEKIVRDAPTSALANFLLLCHYKKTGHPAFDQQAKKTVLLFGDANWLLFQLASVPPAPPPPPESTGDTSSTSSETTAEQSAETTAASLAEAPPNTTTAPDAAADNEISGWPPADDARETPADPPEIVSGHLETPGNAGTGTIETPAVEPEELSFEPLHTVDYFASQGIRLTEDQLKNDKLVNQVRSFTAWLKTMKKLHPSRLEEQSPVDEKQIQSAAEVSNVDTEVLTEAMAEVLIKQQKTGKAIEMYTKLSLINPAKSAYFASRIEQIKSTS